MKKQSILISALFCIMVMAGCGQSEPVLPDTPETLPLQEALPETSEPLPLQDTPPEAPESTHEHQLSAGDNILEHEDVGYCGNTVTTISYHPAGINDGEAWEKSFWGSPSVSLTDLLRYLDYSGGTCRCMPEYTVDTEFGTGYGISLSEGYARYDGGQTDLTEEQIEEIQNILDEIRTTESL